MVPEQIMSIVTSDALKIEPHFKNDHFTTISSHFFCRQHGYLSQKLDSGGHFEVPTMS